MRPLQTDLSVYNKLHLERPPVGIKYLLQKPEGIEPLDKELAFCEMLKEAQQRATPFYFTKEQETCAGKIALGMVDISVDSQAGLLGEKFELFQEARANANLVYSIFSRFPKPAKGTINYVAYSQLDRIPFDPDLLLLVATPGQAEIVLRAMSYSTGQLWETLTTPVFACASLYVYPYQTGKVNYTITGMSFGMKTKKVFPEGLLLISIPYQWIPAITQNLNRMEWVPPGYREDKETFLKMERETMQAATRDAQAP
jgi:uncharacterized protein (DUF169 family)